MRQFIYKNIVLIYEQFCRDLNGKSKFCSKSTRNPGSSFGWKKRSLSDIARELCLAKAQSPTCLKHLLLKEYLSEIANQACIRLALDLLNWVIVHRLGTILCELRLHFCAVSTRNLMKQYTLFCSIVMKCSISIVSNRIADFEPILLLVFARAPLHICWQGYSRFFIRFRNTGYYLKERLAVLHIPYNNDRGAPLERNYNYP